MGRLSILVISSSRIANTLSALNSWPALSGTENTTLVLKSEALSRAACHMTTQPFLLRTDMDYRQEVCWDSH